MSKLITYGLPDTEADYPLDQELLRLESMIARFEGHKKVIVDGCVHHFVPLENYQFRPTLIKGVYQAGLIGASGKSNATFKLRCTICRHQEETSLVNRCPVCAGEIVGGPPDGVEVGVYFDFPSTYKLWLGGCEVCGISLAAHFKTGLSI